MDTGCVELLLRDGRKISIDCTGVEDALNVTMAQQSELDYLIYNDPIGYADLILNGDPENYLKTVTEYKPFNSWLNIARGRNPAGNKVLSLDRFLPFIGENLTYNIDGIRPLWYNY